MIPSRSRHAASSAAIARRPQARALAARLALAGTALASIPAWSQTAPAARVVHADMPAGTSRDALARFARDADVKIDIDDALVQGRTSPGLSGVFNWYGTYTWGAERTAPASVTYKF